MLAEPGRMEAIVDNERGASPVLLVCEHASAFIPAAFGGLGLGPVELGSHAAWDIGAHAVARKLAAALDAPVVAAPASRLLIDPNRDFSAHDLIPETAEGARVPGNLGLSEGARSARMAAFHAPFHDAIDAVLSGRPEIVALIAVHSFTPVLFGARRPWHVGILHDDDTRLADVMLATLKRDTNLVVGRNEPYAPSQGVYYTMKRHSAGRATVMIEVRNDLIRDEIGQAQWARRLAEAVGEAMAALGAGATTARRE